VERPSRTSWTLLLDWGVVSLTLLSAGASALAAFIAFRHEDTSAMAEAVLACGAAIGAAWLGRSAARAMERWQDELVAWEGNDIALLLDEKGRLLDANDRAAEAYGYPLEALYRHHLRELGHADATDDVDERIARILADRRAVFESVHRRRDGAPFPVEVSARTVELRGRRLLHLVVRDVTEAHGARERLVAAERLAAVGSVAAAMAHDINNPLCGVQGNLSYALDVLGDPSPDLDDVRHALEDAQDASRRVRDLVKDLNAFSNGLAEVDAASDLRTVVAETVEATRNLVARRCIVVVDVPPLPLVSMRARRLSQLFTILVRDAAQAMPDGDPALHAIRISARTDGPDRIWFEISDDGPPAYAAAASHAAAPFHAGLPPVGRSGGAGLAAVIGMVRAVGGDVVTESSPERGNTVRVHLPIAVSTAGRPTAPPAPGPRPRVGTLLTAAPLTRRARLTE
jgi:PAS domain S-box-containing protein